MTNEQTFKRNLKNQRKNFYFVSSTFIFQSSQNIKHLEEKMITWFNLKQIKRRDDNCMLITPIPVLLQRFINCTFFGRLIFSNSIATVGCVCHILIESNN